MTRAQVSPPKGRSRRTESRTASISASVIGALMKWSHSAPRGRLDREDVGVITDLSIKRFGCGSYLFASACGFVLAYGTIGMTNSLVLEAARRFFLRGIAV